MATVFSNDGADVIQRTINGPTITRTAADSLYEAYEIDLSVKWITSNGYSRVALQMPDELLVDSAAVAREIEDLTRAVVFVLGDTSYGSCCVDEVAAQHHAADCIIHYGQACLSPTRRLPVLYVFGKQPIDVSHCCDILQQLLPDRDQAVVLLYDLVYYHAVDAIERQLSPLYPNLSVSKVCLPKDSPNLNEVLTTQHQQQSIVTQDETEEDRQKINKFGRTFHIARGYTLDNTIMFYIGSEGLSLTNFIMTFNKSTFFTYDPMTHVGRQETVSVNKLLMKRYYMIEKAKDAKIVGIVVGTLGVADYLTVIARLKDVVKQADKKSYTFVMGKLNVAKMANFMEVDIFVLVACPQNSLLDSSEFYKPVVTPFELEIACNEAREWTGEYITDFRQLLPGASSYVEMAENQTGGTTDVSLVTGKVRTLGLRDDNELEAAEGSTAIVKRDEMLTVANIQANTAEEFLGDRSWKGLEQDLGKTPVVKAEEGRKGIAVGYSHEPQS